MKSFLQSLILSLLFALTVSYLICIIANTIRHIDEPPGHYFIMPQSEVDEKRAK
jgi:hypothetical protein